MDKRFTADVILAAQMVEAKWGVFASICLAQWALESRYGAKTSGRNNFFGIKATASQAGTSGILTQEQDCAGRAHYERDRFANYPTVAAGFDGYGKFLSSRRYTPVRNARTPRDAANQLRACGYATDVDYPDKLMAIIEGNGLTQFDKPSLTLPATAQPARKNIPKAKATAVVVAGGAVVAAGATNAAGSTHWPWMLVIVAVAAVAAFVILHLRKA